MLALLVHAGLLVRIERTPGMPDAVATDATPFEVEIEPPQTELPSEPAEEHADQAQLAKASPSTPARTPVTHLAPPGEEANPSAEPSPAPASSGAFTLSPGTLAGLSNEALGLGGRNRFLGAVPGQGEALSVAEEAPRNVAPGVDQSMRDALDARDHDLGLDIAGPLVAIAEELTRPSDTPMNGRAVFEVLLDTEGNVRDVRVVDVSDSRGSWERLGAQLVATLRARRIALRRKGKAMSALIEVTSRWGLPSGQAAGHVASDPFAKASPEGMQAGGHFDLSDIGARPARSVHARILGERPL